MRAFSIELGAAIVATLSEKRLPKEQLSKRLFVRGWTPHATQMIGEHLCRLERWGLVSWSVATRGPQKGISFYRTRPRYRAIGDARLLPLIAALAHQKLLARNPLRFMELVTNELKET